ncbi:MAG TPA: ABC transporter substrate-binding protein [Rhodocyclaceae bacterium]|nr:ABC transporter substrate-binding protein [Rhodocyclaceae bacterium]
MASKKGWLQEEFAKTGAKVEVVAPSSSLHGQESARLEPGELNFASRMIYPAAVQKARGFDTKLIWISGKSDSYRTPILALKDSPINSLKDLKGKTLGSSRIGCGWTSPFEALDNAGVPLDTELQKGVVRFLNQNNLSEQKYALLSGKIDATAAHIALTDACA